MSRISIITAVVAPLQFVASLVRVHFVPAATIFVLSATGSQARMETPEEVDKILAFLEAENCEIIRDAMGEKKLSVTGTNYTVEAACADGKPYVFTLDQKFKIIDKKPGNN